MANGGDTQKVVHIRSGLSARPPVNAMVQDDDWGASEWTESQAYVRQTQWDGRAAANFICGSAGAGLLCCAGLVGPATGYPYSVMLGLGLVAFGMLCIMAKLGHPLRAFNVLRHAQTSWMTREVLVAPFMFLSGLATLVSGSMAFVVGATFFGAAYVYCQARILQRSQGIPAWRPQASISMMFATGMVDGAGLAALVSLAMGGETLLALAGLLLVALLARRLTWKRYLEAVEQENAHRETIEVLHRIDGPLGRFGQTLPELLLLGGLVFAYLGKDDGMIATLVGVASFAAVASGWTMKYFLITRAAFAQGFQMPFLQIRPKSHKR